MKKTNAFITSPNRRIRKIEIRHFALLSFVLLFSLSISNATYPLEHEQKAIRNWKSQGYPIIFPIHSVEDWVQIDPTKIKCDADNFIAPNIWGDVVDVEAQIPTTKSHKKVSGKLCHHTIYSTTCKVGFFGSTVVSTHIQEKSTTPEACVVAMRDWSIGGLINTGFPPADCSWFSTTVSSNDNWDFADHYVQWNPYSSMYLDPLFPNGACSQSPCTTIHNSLIWMGVYQEEEECLLKDPILVKLSGLYPTQQSLFIGRKTRIYSNHLASYDLMDSCRMLFCGKLGYQFPNGEWIYIDQYSVDPDIQKIPTQLIIPRCKTDLSVKIEAIDEMVSHLENKLLSSKHYESCLTTVAKLIAKEPLTRSDIGSLSPLNPGYHPVYQLKNDFLFVGYSQYSLIFLRKNITAEFVVGYSEEGDPVRWTNWNPGKTSILDGPNGMFLSNGVIIPSSPTGVMPFDKTNTTNELLSIKIAHPLMTAIQSTIFMDNVQYVENETHLYIPSTISNPFNGSWFHNIYLTFLWTIGGIIAIVFVLIITRLFRFEFECWRPRCEEHELQALGNDKA